MRWQYNAKQSCSLRKSFDYIVVGSGSAGATLAGRLSSDGRYRVLLIEAGPDDSSIYIRMPAALGFPLMNDRFNWNYYTEPEPNLDGRNIYEARGRVLGGSSSINGMNWVRGNPWDYDNWTQLGVKGWSYAECLPYFKKAETFEKGGNIYRGGSGPMKIEMSRAENVIFNAFLEAGVQAGYERVDDHNGYRQEGVHIAQRNVHKGIRWSTSQAYIHAAAIRNNLHILTHTRVTRIEFSGARAVRVHCIAHGDALAFTVEREVVVAGGAINSPQILMLSGLGNANDLKRFSIPIVAHLPGVGQGLKDHIAATVQYAVTKNVSIAAELTPLRRVMVGTRWILFKSGLGASNFFEVGAFVRTDDNIKVPNAQIEFIPLLGDYQNGGLEIRDGFQYNLSMMRPKSTGQVWIDSADPLAAPKFVFNYLATENDRRDAVAAVKVIRYAVAQKAWDEYRGEELSPGAKATTDDEILAFLRMKASTNYHPCCTCRMGHDALSVTDESGRVYGADNVRVVDASIMPEIVSGNLNAPVIMLAEKIADDILGYAPLPPEPVPYYRN